MSVQFVMCLTNIRELRMARRQAYNINATCYAQYCAQDVIMLSFLSISQSAWAIEACVHNIEVFVSNIAHYIVLDITIKRSLGKFTNGR